jgi:hypothetical protein
VGWPLTIDESMSESPIIVDLNVIIAAISLPEWVTHDGVIQTEDEETISAARSILSTMGDNDIRISQAMLRTLRHVLIYSQGLDPTRVENTIEQLIDDGLRIDPDEPLRHFRDPPTNADGSYDPEDTSVASYVESLRETHPDAKFITNDEQFARWFKKRHSGATRLHDIVAEETVGLKDLYGHTHFAKLAETLHDEPYVAYYARKLVAVERPADQTATSKTRLTQAKAWAEDIVTLASIPPSEINRDCLVTAAHAMRGLNDIRNHRNTPDVDGLPNAKSQVFPTDSLKNPRSVYYLAVYASQPRFAKPLQPSHTREPSPETPLRPSRAPLVIADPQAATPPTASVGLSLG